MELFQMQLVSICLLTQVHFSNTKKITWADKVCAICGLRCIFTPNYTRNHVIASVNNLHEKSITGSQDRRNFESACVQFVIFTWLATLHLCYMTNALEVHNFFIYIIMMTTCKSS